MQATDFFSSTTFQLPVVFATSNFRAELSSYFNDYVNLVASLEGSSNPVLHEIYGRLGNIRQLCASLTVCLDEYDKGLPASSLRHFSKAIEAVANDFNAICLKDRTSAMYKLSRLYRARQDTRSLLTRKDLFHIPLDERSKVGAQRYSIPGLPCLYLGTSTYVCWEELGRPSLDLLSFSRYELSKEETINVINLSTVGTKIAEDLQDYFDSEQPEATTHKAAKIEAISRAACWPLMAACTVRTYDRRASFKPEYIIPQLLMQFVTEAQYDGIMYFSTNINATGVSGSKCINFVFPSKGLSEQYCSWLRKKFVFTEPLSWALCDLANAPKLHNDKVPNETIQITPEQSMLYEFTKFGEFEMKLASQTPTPF